MRALSKYVPVDLVRELYGKNVEPTLGAEQRELTVMFSDLEGFTSLSEKLAPAELARLLGAYLEAMTTAIRSTSGAVDKFVGDAVMALWNAPSERADHAVVACEAILRCQEATRKLYASAAWSAAPLRTRFGLHCDRVLVGHFGAPDRLSYTAIGDGVNLAARLESLCKQYGVSVLVSDAVVERAREKFAFRLVDRVAVKGKTQAVVVYELLGRRDEAIAALPAVRRYEEAFQAYSRRDFAAACALLSSQPEDGPSRVLHERCQALIAAPPSSEWNGVHRALGK
jgi:adenylate cyclase